MKLKSLLPIVLGALLGVAAYAAQSAYNGKVADEPGLTYNSSFDVNLNTTPDTAGINTVSAQTVVSSVTYSACTFTDGHVSTGTFTVNSLTGLENTYATDQVTVPSTQEILAQGATVQVVLSTSTPLYNTYVTVNGNALYEGVHWARVATATGTAINLASAIDKVGGVDATAVGQVIYATATVAGAAGNSFTIASSTSAITVSSTSFSGGHDPALRNAVLTVNGKAYREGYLWAYADTSTGTAANLASFLDTISGIDAASSGSVVYATSTVAGTAGNAITLASNNAKLVVASANFKGGEDAAVLTIGGTRLVEGVDWYKTDTASGTAHSIADAINANSTLNQVLESTFTNSVVNATSTVVGADKNYSLTSSTNAISAFASAMYGGVDTDLLTSSNAIQKTSHGFTLGTKLLYTASAGTSPGHLVAGTTYYAMPIDANSFRLAGSIDDALAGTAVSASTQTVTGGGNFALTPLEITGIPSLKWQVSNDCVNYADYLLTSYGVDVDSATYKTYTLGGATTVWDFGPVDFACLRLKVVAPLSGGIDLRATVNGKR